MSTIDSDKVVSAPAQGEEHAPTIPGKRPGRPRVSVIVPAYLSHETITSCLEALRHQDHESFEVVVVDSSPDERTARAVRRAFPPEVFPELRFVRSWCRLLPHAARNLGVARSRGELLVFTDPDIYAPPGWLTRLVGAHDATGQPVVGALSCHGDRWLDRAVHLCKFSKWLPAGEPRPIDMSPTANMLLDRALFEAVGGFDGALMLGDALLSWRLLRHGATLWFEPGAGVDHHHLSTFGGFLRERYRRGVLFGDLRGAWERHSRRRALVYLGVSLLPVRLARIGALVVRHCRAAGETGTLLATFPLVLLGHAASLLGESRAHLARALRRERPAAEATRQREVEEVASTPGVRRAV
jgi:GT2 family glycosyltransferase